MRRTFSSLIAIIGAALSVTPALAAFTYIDTTDKIGLPDLTQDDKGGVCGAAAMANAFWNWSGYGPFNTPVRPLVDHTDATNYAYNWGVDSDKLSLRMATAIYGAVDETNERTGGLGMSAGAVTVARLKGKAYNKTTNPNGLSVELTYGWQNITYSKLNTLVQGQVQNAVLGIKWYQANGTVVKRPADLGGDDRFHAVTLTGIDNLARKIALSNPWGDHAATPRVADELNPPVKVDYYDAYTLDATEITNNNLPVIKKAGAGNTDFVNPFDNATYTGAYIRPVALWQVKKGGSPNVTGFIDDKPGFQSVRYTVENPDSPEPIANAYILLDPQAINIPLAYSAATSWLVANRPDWTVSILDPNSGAAADLFDATGEDADPDAPDYQLAGWQSGAAGLVFSTSSPNALLVGDSVELGFDMPGFADHGAWDNVYAAATLDSGHSWWGVTAVPEPSGMIAIALAAFVAARRRV